MTPQYIVYISSATFYICSNLAEALDRESEFGGIIYEPLGMTTAEKVNKDADSWGVIDL